ncbi:DMT family transporter [Cognatishimia activa]|uniref:DMT family transporter n=1 Tax=Cognatishimia activa TaxID=1715691 RepID=UPI002231E886|nr:DMT family transporter [Cognatishimia activa]UZD89841.1 DMT family transporter [Cognatishimia activa]
MRLIALTALTMVAFAANSVLNRMAIVDGGMDAFVFAVVRLLAGALLLAALMLWQRKSFEVSALRNPAGVVSLLVYLFGFSLAYRVLPSGVGALLLFGMVQVTMFGAAVLGREVIPMTRWAGTGFAFLGLCWMLWPQPGVQTPFLAMSAMLIAGIGWGVYSLAGRGAKDPVQATALNFIFAAPVGLVMLLILPVNTDAYTANGVALAILSGAVTSGLGYALWYRILPTLGATRAAVAQLTVPVIATLGGVAFLSEAVTLQFGISSILVLGGVGLAILRK